MRNNIRKFRRELGLSQRELADAVGTSQQQIHRIENGLHRVDLVMATQICVKLNKTIEETFPCVNAIINSDKGNKD
jgi:DNA-binding XRE family transcriptional regulator